MSTRFKNIDRHTAMLLPVDLREWVPEDDMVHFVLEAVESIPSHMFSVNERGTGSEQYPPSMMLGLLIYCYAHGIFSSRRIERATYRDVSVRYLSGNTHPDHDTIAAFRRRNFDAVAACFVKVLELAKELGLLRVGTVSVDGTQIKANASKHKNVTYQRAGELAEQLEVDIRALLEKAEKADREDGDTAESLPEELKKREQLKKKMEKACRDLAKRAQARADKERAEYERKVKERGGRTGRSKGKKIQEPSEEPKDNEQVNLSDADSHLMRKNKRSSYTQSYNAQAVVDAEGSLS